MDKESKRKRIKAWENEQQALERAQLPLDDDVIESLFAAVDVQLNDEPCDHTRSKADAWLASRGLDVAVVGRWLGRTGGYCDCEVVSNSKDAWLQATGRA